MNKLEIAIALGLFLTLQLGPLFLAWAYSKHPLANFLLRLQGPRAATEFGTITRKDVWLSAVAAGSVALLEFLLAWALRRGIAAAPPHSALEYGAILLFLLTGAFGVAALFFAAKYAEMAVNDVHGGEAEFVITCRGVRIGTADLDVPAPNGLILRGPFLPAPAFAEFAEEVRQLRRDFTLYKYTSIEGREWQPEMIFTTHFAERVRALDLKVVGPRGPVELPGMVFLDDQSKPGGSRKWLAQVWSPDAEEWRKELKLVGRPDPRPPMPFGLPRPKED